MASSNPSYNTSGINWGPWSRLPNGQWHREGQDSSGTWYEENQDVDPLSPRNVHSMEDLDDAGFSNLYGGFDDHARFDNLAMDSFPAYYQNHQGYGTSLDFGGYDQVTKHEKNKSKHTRNPEQAEASHHNHDRNKSSRSSKSDVRGPRAHGKITSSSRTDAKGKGREIDIQPVHLPTADDDVGDITIGGKHAGGGVEDVAQKVMASSSQTPPIKTSPTYTMPLRTSRGRYTEKVEGLAESQRSLQDVADAYSGANLEESSSSSTSILATGYYQPADADEDMDGVPDLPGPSSYPKPSRSRTPQEISHYNEDWSRYIVENSRKYTFGTVFKVMWTEPLGSSRLSRQNKDPVNTGIPISEFGQRKINGTTLYEGIRRFVVVDGTENGARNGNSICVPIATYGKQGCTKHGVKPQNHGVIYTHDKTPMLLSNEPDLGVPPIRLVVNRHLEGVEKLAPESRINYSKHVTIEHNAPVFIIGRVHHDDLHALEEAVDTLWEKRVRDRKKDKKQPKPARGERHTSNKLNEENSRSVETPPKISRLLVPDLTRLEGQPPDHKPDKPDEHSGSDPRPKPFSPDYHPDQASKDGDNPGLFGKVWKKSIGMHEKPQEPHVSVDSHGQVSGTQDSREELDSRLDSLTISNNVTHGQSSHAEGPKADGIVSTFSSNSPKSPGSSICLTEAPSDTSATESNLTTLQRRKNTIRRLITYVTPLFQAGTQFQSDNSPKHTDSSSNKTGDNATSSKTGNQTSQSYSGTAQPIPPHRKRKVSDHSSEEESDREDQSSGRASKGKQKEVLFACPYVKRYSSARCNNNNKGWPTVARVKEHLYRHHRQAIHCPRCCTTFKDQDAKNTHLRELEKLCVSSNKASLEGFDEKQEKDLKSRKGLCNLTEEEKWLKNFKILFPDYQGQMPSPYFDPNDSHEPLAKLNANQRRKLVQLLAQHVNKKLKARHGEHYESGLKQEDYEEVVDKALESGSSDTFDEHYNSKGNGVTARDSLGQSSYQPQTPAVWPPCDDMTFDGFISAQLQSLMPELDDLDDQFPNFCVNGDFVPSTLPHSDPIDLGTGNITAGPDHQQDTDIYKPISDSGYSSTQSQGPQEIRGFQWPSFDTIWSRREQTHMGRTGARK